MIKSFLTRSLTKEHKPFTTHDVTDCPFLRRKVDTLYQASGEQTFSVRPDAIISKAAYGWVNFGFKEPVRFYLPSLRTLYHSFWSLDIHIQEETFFGGWPHRRFKEWWKLSSTLQDVSQSFHKPKSRLGMSWFQFDFLGTLLVTRWSLPMPSVSEHCPSEGRSTQKSFAARDTDLPNAD